MQEQIDSLDAALAALRFKRPELVAHFYGRLFGRSPELEALFAGHDQLELNRKFSGALQAVVRHAQTPNMGGRQLVALAEDHARRGVTDPAYLDLFGEAMLQSLRHFLGARWNPILEQRWNEAFAATAHVFLKARDAALEDRHPDSRVRRAARR